jgi:glycogen operon protein
MKLLIGRRLLRDVEAEVERKTLEQFLFDSNKTWHGVKVEQPDRSRSSHSLAFTAEIPKKKLVLHGFQQRLERTRVRAASYGAMG